MKLYKHIPLISSIGLVTLLLGGGIAFANPSFFAGISNNTSSTATTATTSPTFFQVATATTTVVVYDSYIQGQPTKTNNAALLVEFGATSTSAVATLTYQYAHDVNGNNCVSTPLICDWFDDNLVINAPTAVPINVTSPTITTWTTLAAGTSSKIFNLLTPVRYVRVQAKLAGAPGNIWAEIVPSKEQKQ